MISIHAPHTGRDTPDMDTCINADISIHAPHTGRDYQRGYVSRLADPISIHAPHTGRDCSQYQPVPKTSYFNPRAPYGARRGLESGSPSAQNFNPRAPYGARRVVSPNSLGNSGVFQSTRPIRGATSTGQFPGTPPFYFNPRAPYGARRFCETLSTRNPGFQSTRPIRGATLVRLFRWRLPTNFNPRAPYGARP